MTPEGKIEAYLKKRVLETGGRIRKLSWPGHRGAPDRMIWWPDEGHGLTLVFVEVKAPGKKPTKQQLREHKKLENDGFEVWVVNDTGIVDLFVGPRRLWA